MENNKNGWKCVVSSTIRIILISLFWLSIFSVTLLGAITRGTVAQQDDSNIGAGTPNQLTGYTIDVGSDRLLLFAASFESKSGVDKSLTAVTYGGVSMTLVVEVRQGVGDQFCSIWMLKEADLPTPTTNSYDFAATHVISGNIQDTHYACMTIGNVDQAVIPSGSEIASWGAQNTNTHQLDVTAAEADGYTIWVSNQGRPGTTTWTSGPTEQSDFIGGTGNSMSGSMADKLETSTATTSGTATHTGATNRPMCMVAATFGVVAGGGGGDPLPTRRRRILQMGSLQEDLGILGSLISTFR